MHLNHAKFQDNYMAFLDYKNETFFLSSDEVLDSTLRLLNPNAYFQADFRLINKVNNY